MKKRWIKIILITAIPVIIAGGAYCYWVINKAKKEAAKKEAPKAVEASSLDRTFKVQREPLTIGLRISGNVTASKKHKLSLQANYRTKLLTVVDENTKVKKGDVLAVFESDELKEKIDELKTNLSNQDKELAIAIENAKIQESSNEMDRKVAEDRLAQAEDALRKYLRLERSNTRNSLRLKISTAETELETAQQEYAERKKAIDAEGVSDEDAQQKNEKELNRLQNTIDSKRNALSSARNDRKAFQRYDNPIKLLKLYNELDQAKLNQEKVKISTASSLVQKNKQVDNLKNNIRRIANQLHKYESYLPMMTLYAPADGIVIYADPDRRWGNPDVKPGMDIWKGLVILTIPEMSNLMVDFDLPEQYRSKVDLGNKVIITPDSLPTLKLNGKISKIATLPVNQISWDSASPKVYNSRISLTRQHPQLVNGMSVSVEIISKVIPDTLFVPVEAVFENDGKFFVYLNTLSGPEEVDVKIGESNDRFVQILEGLEEDDVVYLYRPYQKKQE